MKEATSCDTLRAPSRSLTSRQGIVFATIKPRGFGTIRVGRIRLSDAALPRAAVMSGQASVRPHVLRSFRRRCPSALPSRADIA
jgi:hypothetical protein